LKIRFSYLHPQLAVAVTNENLQLLHFFPCQAPLHGGQPFNPKVEDRESIQVALSVVINALATGNLEGKRATALLYGLQIASSNCARLSLIGLTNQIVHTAETTPDGVDLAQPGATYAPPNLTWDEFDEEGKEYGEEEEDGEEEDDDDEKEEEQADSL